LPKFRIPGWKPLKATATATKPIATEPRAPRSAAKKPRAGTKQAVAAKKGAPKLSQEIDKLRQRLDWDGYAKIIEGSGNEKLFKNLKQNLNSLKRLAQEQGQ
jgi:hypothetical protein